MYTRIIATLRLGVSYQDTTSASFWNDLDNGRNTNDVNSFNLGCSRTLDERSDRSRALRSVFVDDHQCCRGRVSAFWDQGQIFETVALLFIITMLTEATRTSWLKNNSAVSTNAFKPQLYTLETFIASTSIIRLSFNDQSFSILIDINMSGSHWSAPKVGKKVFLVRIFSCVGISGSYPIYSLGPPLGSRSSIAMLYYIPHRSSH